MKIKTIKTFSLTYLLVAAFIAVLAVQADAVVTGPQGVTIKKACISMPDGTVTTPTGTPAVTCPAGTIVMWLPADNAAVPPATGLLAPGSFKITAAEGDSLTINVRNEMGIPVSLVIPGQVMNPNNGPVWFSDINNPYGSTVTLTTPGLRNVGDVTSRVRSFAHETSAGAAGTPGPPMTYIWPSLKEGTYLILSGTHPSLQVPMGIYGILVVQAAGGGPYDGVAAPDNDITLLFSEIDPAIHNAANDVTKSFPSTNDYKPKYFLINGKPFPGNDPVLIGTAGQTTLLRFLNAGIDTYIPLLQGQSMQVLAEDAFLKPANLRFTRYSVDLHAGKTFDALITNPAAGYIPVYDRRLYLSNADQAPGGMLAYLEVSDATQYQLNITKGGTGTGTVAVESAPGGTYCQTSSTAVPLDLGCSQLYNANTEIKLVGHPNPGSILALASDGTPFDPVTDKPVAWTGCDPPAGTVTDANECLITMSAAKPVTANFKAFDKLKLLTPNGGETIPAGSAYLVQWGAPANAATFRLKYSLDNGTTWLLIKGGITGNTFSWIVPTPSKNRKSALLQITAFNKAGTNIGSDVSNAVFTIETVTVTVPAENDTLISGNIAPPSTITWVSNATPGLVKRIVIEYSKNNGATWKTVEGVPVKGLDNSSGIYDAGGSFSQWVIPAVSVNKPDSFVRVTLKDAAGNIVAKDRSGKFKIRVP